MFRLLRSSKHYLKLTDNIHYFLTFYLFINYLFFISVKKNDLTNLTYSSAHDGCEGLAESVVRGGLLVRRGRSVGRGRRGRRCTRTMAILQRCRRRRPCAAVRRDRGTTPECRHWRQGSRTGHRRAQDRRCRFTIRRHRWVCLKPPSANGSTLGSCGNHLGGEVVGIRDLQH